MTPPGIGRRALFWLSGALTVGVFAVPILVVAARGLTSESALKTAAGSAFVRATPSGTRIEARQLVDLVSLWREFHLVKAALAVLLVLALARLVAVLSRQPCGQGARPPRRAERVAFGGVLAWMLVALTIALANLQGAVAPLASVSSLIPPPHPSSELGAVLGELRRAVQIDPTAPAGLAGDLLIDFTRYHATLAILATVVGAALIVLALRAVVDGWRRRRGAAAPGTWPWQLGLCGGAGAFFLVVAAANASTWLNPAPALVASLGGG